MCVCVSQAHFFPLITYGTHYVPSFPSRFVGKLKWHIRSEDNVYKACRHVSCYHFWVYLGTGGQVFTPWILYVSYQWASKKYLCSPLFTTLRFPEVLFQLLALPGIVLQSQKGKGTVMTTSCCKVMAFRGFAVYKVSCSCCSFQYGTWKIIGSLPKVRSTSSFSSYHWTASEYRSQKGSWRFCSNT